MMRKYIAETPKYQAEYLPDELVMLFLGTPLGDLLVRFPSHWHVIDHCWTAFNDPETIEPMRQLCRQILAHYNVPIDRPAERPASSGSSDAAPSR